MTNIAAMDKKSLTFYRTGLNGWISDIQDTKPEVASPEHILEKQLDDTVQLCSQVLRVHELIERLEADANAPEQNAGAAIIARAFAKEIRKALAGLD